MTTRITPLCRKLLPFASLSFLLASAPAVWSQTGNSNENDEIFELSPFEVTSSEDDIGYYASNTLAGSRLNTNLADLAAPITVVTKQQMEDTGATSFNEVFLYEANIEGAYNYTPVELNRGGLKDRVGGSATNGGVANNATTANRVRGIAAPDFGWNYYPSMARIPADGYNVRSIEINRGPNSILFGLGSPAGIVNQSVGYATVGDDSTDLQFRVGTNGVRTSASTNQSFLDDRMAIFVAGVYDEKNFSRKPSQDISRRATVGLTVKPWAGATIRGFYEHYENTSRLPNSLLPRDGITPWIESGRPVWNPLTQQFTYLDSGQVNPFRYTSLASDVDDDGVSYGGDRLLDNPDSPRFIRGVGWMDNGRPNLRVSPNGSFSFPQRRATTNFPDYGFNDDGTPRDQSQWLNADPSRRAFYDRRMAQSALSPMPSNFYSNWTAPALTNKNIYDWTEYNLLAVNYGEFEGDTYNVEFEQKIIENLYFTAGWFRQEYDSFEYYPLGQQQPVTILMDINMYDLDGSPNPNYLVPYVEDYQQDAVTAPAERDVVRAMLAYELDLSDKDGLIKWLGRHRAMGLYQWQEDYEYYNRYRMAFVEPTANPWIPDTKNSNFYYAANTSNIRRSLYLGNGSTPGVVTAGSSSQWDVPFGHPLSTSIRAYDWNTRSFREDETTLEHVHYHAGNGVGVNNRKITSYAGVLQSYFLEDRIITTLGMRRDKWEGRANTLGNYWAPGADRNGPPTLAEIPIRNSNDEGLYPVGNDYRLANVDYLRHGRFTQAEVIEKTTGTMGVVVKPLSWLSFHYNTSENFAPPPSQQFNIYSQSLPEPEGEGYDYGVSLNLFDNKLIARFNMFHTESKLERVTPNVLGRVINADTQNFRAWAETVVRLRAGEDRSDTDPQTGWASTPLTPAQEQEVEELTGQDYRWPGLDIASTQSNESDGFEFELIYNPMPNWNIKLVVAKQDASYSSIMPEYEAWVAQRRAVWEAAVAPDLAGEYDTSREANPSTISVERYWTGWGFGNIPAHPNSVEWSQTPQSWFTTAVDGAIAESRQLEGAAPFGQRKYRANIITNYRFTEGPLEGFSIGGAIRMEDKAIIGYHGLKTDVDPVTQADLDEEKYYAADASRPIYDTDVGADRWRDLTHIDLWFKYDFDLGEKMRASVQLNIRDLFADEDDLVPVYANWDGSVANYRIKEPRQIFLTTSLSF
ncbi:MAG: TonB-dependent receptor plug domain-containing protein [Verrucomicrobiota bacterium JB022]|nr:TonB-dependent receptor plug domain-containing protein [Verrucomicrobiota bacterium JB022]